VDLEIVLDRPAVDPGARLGVDVGLCHRYSRLVIPAWPGAAARSAAPSRRTVVC
jgi:hypothetical protein